MANHRKNIKYETENMKSAAMLVYFLEICKIVA